MARTNSQERPLTRKIGRLKRERAQLEEEVLQLRAAVNIWSEVCRHTMASVGTNPNQFGGEVR